MSTELTLRTGRHSDGRAALIAQGEIDMTNVAEFRSALASAITEHDSIVMDLTGVTYLDSGAFNALFVHAEHLHLVCSPLLLSALRISGLTELATIETVEA